MKVTVRPAPELGPGHAWLTTDAPLPEGAKVAIVNDEAKTNRYLGPNGWQSTRFDIPLAVEPAHRGSRALLGPAICDPIRESLYVLILLSETRIFEDFWPTIAPSGLRGQAGGVVAFRTPTKAVDPVAVQPPPLPSPPPESEDAGAAGRLPPPMPGEPSASETGDGRPRRWSGLLMGAGALALVCLAGGALVWARPELLDPIRQFLPETQDAQASGDPAGEVADIDLGPDGWRRLIADPSSSPERLASLGLALRQRDPETAEIGFEAIYEASRRGNGEAAAWYARANDPTLDVGPADRVLQPNVRRALEIYARGAQGQDSTPSADVQRLCDHLRGRRFSGTNTERTSFQDFCS